MITYMNISPCSARGFESGRMDVTLIPHQYLIQIQVGPQSNHVAHMTPAECVRLLLDCYEAACASSNPGYIRTTIRDEIAQRNARKQGEG